MNNALSAVAKLANIDLDQAAGIVRRNPLLGEEIHIAEELINLEESLASHRVADNSLRQYPKLYTQVIREQRLMLKHCFGQLVRMTQGRRLPRRYTEQDVTYSFSKLVQILIGEALRAGKPIDEKTLDTVKPYLSLRQRYQLKEWDSFSPRMYIQALRYRLSGIVQTS